jgi:23S rRNA pseudouridine1911/1915/1917 synthase
MNRIIQEDEQSLRLDKWCLMKYPNFSRAHLQKRIQDGLILVNDNKVKTGYILKKDDVVQVIDVELKPLAIEASDVDFDIIYEDEHLAVINKPRGIVVHPTPTYAEKTLVHGLMKRLSSLSGINGVMRPGIIHRIDKDTTGLLIVAKHDEAHQKLSSMLQTHDIEREYQALVHGHVDQDEATIDMPIGRHPKDRHKMAVIHSGRHAVTHFKVIQKFPKHSLLHVKLETGRTHQIRVHLSHIGLPIVGDSMYGHKKEAFGQMLHAFKLSLVHPMTNTFMTFEVPLPHDFTEILNSI